MARDFLINGECLVTVKGGAHMSGRNIGNLAELGLASEGIRVEPHFGFVDMHVDDFGQEAPVDTMAMPGWATINMNLIHYDRNVLDICWREAMGWGVFSDFAGFTAPAGKPLGGYKERFASGNHLIGLNLSSPVETFPWRFLYTHLTAPPLMIPLGTKTSIAQLVWRAIPYVLPTLSGGTEVHQGSSGIMVPATSGLLPGSLGVSGNVLQTAELRSSGARIYDHTLDT